MISIFHSSKIKLNDIQTQKKVQFDQTMTTHTITFTLSIVIPDSSNGIQFSVSTPQVNTQPTVAPSAPIKRAERTMPKRTMPKLIEDDSDEEEKHHTAARSLYYEMNQEIPPFDASSSSTYSFDEEEIPCAPFPRAFKEKLVSSLERGAAIGISSFLYKKLRDFLANVTYIKGYTPTRHVVSLFEKYESWVEATPVKVLRHLNRYQRMARFLNELE